MNALISVIVPIYNAEKTLKECVDSIINQSHENLEILLVNDGSNDNSLKICYEYERLDKRIKVIDKTNGGVSSARNLGLKYSEGDYIGFVDSDDTIDPNMYKYLYELIEPEDSGSVLINNSMKSSKLQSSTKKKLSAYEGMKFLFKLQLPASQCAYLYRKNNINGIKNREEIHFFEDFLFNFEFLKNATSIKLCRENMYHYRRNPESINHQGINVKKMSSLLIYSIILEEGILEKDKELKQHAQYFRAHFLISLILAFAKTKEMDQEKKNNYKCLLQVESKRTKKDIILSNVVPIIYKVLIILMSKFPVTTLKIVQLKYLRENQR